MRSLTTDIVVEWEDCDPAGLVFYPRFLFYFDRGSWNLWHAIGLDLPAMKALGAFGFPALEAKATFHYPCRFRDRLRIVSEVAEINSKTVRVDHTIYNGEQEAVTGYEVRFWGVGHPADPQGVRAGVIPDEVLKMLK